MRWAKLSRAVARRPDQEAVAETMVETTMERSSWIVRSRQTWKLWVFHILMVATLGLIGVFIASVNDVQLIPGVDEFGLALMFLVSGFGGLGWLLFAIRCPYCGHRPVWPTLKHANAGDWLSTLFAMTVCPACRRDL